jgi:hypothetical protein
MCSRDFIPDSISQRGTANISSFWKTSSLKKSRPPGVRWSLSFMTPPLDLNQCWSSCIADGPPSRGQTRTSLELIAAVDGPSEPPSITSAYAHIAATTSSNARKRLIFRSTTLTEGARLEVVVAFGNTTSSGCGGLRG